MSNASVTAHNPSSDASIPGPTFTMQQQPPSPHSLPANILSKIAFGDVPRVYKEYVRERDAAISRPTSMLAPSTSASGSSNSSSSRSVQSASTLPSADRERMNAPLPELPPAEPESGEGVPSVPGPAEESILANSRLMQLADSSKRKTSSTKSRASNPTADAAPVPRSLLPMHQLYAGQSQGQRQTPDANSKRQTLGAHSPRQGGSFVDGPIAAGTKGRAAETLVRRSDGRDVRPPKEKEKEKEKRTSFLGSLFSKKDQKHTKSTTNLKQHSPVAEAPPVKSSKPPVATMDVVSGYRALSPSIPTAESATISLLRKSSTQTNVLTTLCKSQQSTESSLDNLLETSASASSLSASLAVAAPSASGRRFEAESPVEMRSKRASVQPQTQAQAQEKSRKRETTQPVGGGGGEKEMERGKKQRQSGFVRPSRFSVVSTSFTNLASFLRRSSTDITALARKNGKSGSGNGKSKLSLPAASSVVDVQRASERKKRVGERPANSGAGAGGREGPVPASALSDAESDDQQAEADLDDVEVGGAVRGLGVSLPPRKSSKDEKAETPVARDEADSDNMATLKPHDVRAFREASRAQHERERAQQQQLASARYIPTTTVIPLTSAQLPLQNTTSTAASTATAGAICASATSAASASPAVPTFGTNTMSFIAMNSVTPNSCGQAVHSDITSASSSAFASTSTCNTSSTSASAGLGPLPDDRRDSQLTQRKMSQPSASASASNAITASPSFHSNSAQCTTTTSQANSNSSSSSNSLPVHSTSTSSESQCLSRPLPPAAISRTPPVASSSITNTSHPLLAKARAASPQYLQCSSSSSSKLALLATCRPDDSFPPLYSHVSAAAPPLPPRRSVPNAAPTDASRTAEVKLRRSLKPAPPPPTPADTIGRDLRMQVLSRRPRDRPEGAIEALTRLSQARAVDGAILEQRRTSVCVFPDASASADRDAFLQRLASGLVTQDDIASDTLKRSRINRCTSAVNTLGDALHRFGIASKASSCAAEAGAGRSLDDPAADAERNGTDEFDPDATLKRPPVPVGLNTRPSTLIAAGGSGGGGQLRDRRALHGSDTCESFLRSSSPPSSAIPDEPAATTAGVSRRSAPFIHGRPVGVGFRPVSALHQHNHHSHSHGHCHNVAGAAGGHAVAFSSDSGAGALRRGCRVPHFLDESLHDDGRGESCDECAMAAESTSTRAQMERCFDRVIEMDARLRYRLEERELLIQHLLRKLQRPTPPPTLSVHSTSTSTSASSSAAASPSPPPPPPPSPLVTNAHANPSCNRGPSTCPKASTGANSDSSPKPSPGPSPGMSPSAQLLETCAELAAISRQLAILKAPLPSGLHELSPRKSHPRVLFTGSCASALHQPRNRASIGYSSSNSSSASSGTGVAETPETPSSASSNDRALIGAHNLVAGTVRVPSAMLQRALDVLKLSSELYEACAARRQQQQQQQAAQKTGECGNCGGAETLPPDVQTIRVLNSPAILLDNP